MTLSVTIAAGQLDISIHTSRRPLDELLTFASRENPKRGFLFISKILGKHWPVAPSAMRAAYDELAQLIQAGTNSYVVGMAETATGLGAGVADSLSRLQNAAVFYQHTTRCQTDHPLWLSLDEAHSHAVDHLFYQPHPALLADIQKSQRLILVDDEITTGRTLQRLAERLLPKLPEVKEVVIVALVSWLDEQARQQLSQFPVPVRFVTLLEGQFSFTPNPTYQAHLPADVDHDLSHVKGREDLGRFGLKMPYQGAVHPVAGDNPLTVIGDGEHLYLPFLIAEATEKQGRLVHFQSTTRSPIAHTDGISNKLSFAIDERPLRHYLYNFQHSSAGESLFVLEDENQRAQHGLPPLLTTQHNPQTRS
ncbi:MAG: phosphoribosyltransferase domain-containing protein [Gammaproteobacteria bacterium]|nr:phosphoribosyltransferase domain-containing protein [Gammaproteobacteria bacterium]